VKTALVADVLLLALMLGLCFVAAARDGTTVAPQPAPRHVEWEEFPVGGLILVNPARIDSTGTPANVVLPDGVLLEVPHWVDGEASDPTREAHTR
jgi:hypothetical protein